MKKGHWIAALIKLALEKVPNVEEIIYEENGGDYCTHQFILQVANTSEDNRYLYVRGFSTGSPLPQQDDVYVEMVEISSGHSDGTTQDPELGLAQAYVRAALIRMGFVAVNSLDSYF